MADWTRDIALPYCTVVGRFGSIIEDRTDDGLNPDIIPAETKVTFTPESETTVYMGAFLTVYPVEAYVKQGVLVSASGDQEVRIMASDRWQWTVDIPGFGTRKFSAKDGKTVNLAYIFSG